MDFTYDALYLWEQISKRTLNYRITLQKKREITFFFVPFCTAPLIGVGLLLLFFYPLKFQLLLQDCLFATLLLNEEEKRLCTRS